MNPALDDMMLGIEKDSERRASTLQRLLQAADGSKVFGQPTAAGDYTVITAAEVAAGGGFGSGMGFGMPRRGKEAAAAGVEASAGGDSVGDDLPQGGGGGGGGGGSIGRPVAAIVIGPDGVRVKPIVDATKLGLAALTAWGAVVTIAIKMAKST